MLEKGTVVFGNWTVEETIGSGAFGTVYKIKRVDFGGEYFAAMKVIRIPQDKGDKNRLYSEGLNDADIALYYKQIAKDFVKEIKMLSSLDGVTNIVDYKDHIIEPNEDSGYTIYIKMQLLTPVSRLLIDEGNKAKFLSNEDVIRLGMDMCTALDVCEKKRIIHRDVKVDNIFISAEGYYKLGDFGIARQLEATQGEMSKKGTLMYMAPEVFKGEKYDRTADIYSLGIVLYRLLNKNRAPFYPDYPNPIKLTDKDSANAKRLKGDELPDIEGVSVELNAVLKKACAFNPRDRYQTAGDFKVALEGVRESIVAPVIIPPVVTANENNTEADSTVGLFSTMGILPAMNIGASDDATVAAGNSFDDATVAAGNSFDDATEAALNNSSFIESDFTATQAIFGNEVLSDTIYDKETVTLVETEDKTESLFDSTLAVTTPVTENKTDDATDEASNVSSEDSSEKETKKSRIIKLATRIALGLGVAALILFGKNYDNNHVVNDEDSSTTKTAQTTNNKGTTVGMVPTNGYYNDGYYNDNYYNDNNYNDIYYNDNYYNDGYYDDNYYDDDDDDYYDDDYDNYYDYNEYS